MSRAFIIASLTDVDTQRLEIAFTFSLLRAIAAEARLRGCVQNRL